MKVLSNPCCLVALSISTMGTAAVNAAVFTPSASDLAAMVSINFGPGGNVVAVTADSGGALVTMDFTPPQGGFSRATSQREDFDINATGFDSFDVNVTNVAGVTGVKMFVQTGPGFAFFETPFIALALNTETLVSLDLSGVSDINEIQQFGFQFFGDTSLGNTTGNQALVTPIPEPASLALLGLGGVALLSRKRVA